MKLDVNFTEQVVEVEEGLNFYAMVKIPCTVTQEMLQDIALEYCLEDKVTQFENSKIQLQKIAENKINEACKGIKVSVRDLA